MQETIFPTLNFFYKNLPNIRKSKEKKVTSQSTFIVIPFPAGRIVQCTSTTY